MNGFNWRWSSIQGQRLQKSSNPKSRIMVTFSPEMIAPCGLNCGTCIGYMRTKNPCPGCRVISLSKAPSVRHCRIAHCEELEKSGSEFCYACTSFPCRRLKQLDKRYSTKYRTSAIQNLHMIRENMDSFLAFEAARRTCPACGAVICVHRTECLKCNQSVFHTQ